jgi:hypothetical protein
MTALIILALIAGAFCLWVREQYHADKSMPEELSDWRANRWLK